MKTAQKYSTALCEKLASVLYAHRKKEKINLEIIFVPYVINIKSDEIDIDCPLRQYVNIVFNKYRYWDGEYYEFQDDHIAFKYERSELESSLNKVIDKAMQWIDRNHLKDKSIKQLIEEY